MSIDPSKIMGAKYTILLADDHSILRSGLKAILSSQNNLEVVGEVDNGRDAIHSTIALKPDLLLTDLSMPKTNGTEAIREIKRRVPETKILVLTMHSGEEHVHAALKAGADGYVLKDDSQVELINAINSILTKKTHLSPGVCSSIINRYLNVPDPTNPTSSWDTLTHREREVLKLIAEGNRNKDVANYLSISIKTVEKHRSNLMRKLNLHSVSSLINYAIQNNVICCE